MNRTDMIYCPACGIKSTAGTRGKESYDSIVSERDQLRQRVAELEAHVEEATEFVRELAAYTGSNRVYDWLEKQRPPTSLARRDLIKQAEGADIVAKAFEGEYGDYIKMIEQVAAELRQQAEELS